MEKTTIYIGKLFKVVANDNTGNLNQEVDEESLKAAFIPFGEIKSVDIPIDPMTEAAKGFAHIEFEEPEDCEHAIFNMNESEFFGKVIRVQYAKPSKKGTSNKSVWQSEEYQQTVAELPPERSGLVRMN